MPFYNANFRATTIGPSMTKSMPMSSKITAAGAGGGVSASTTPKPLKPNSTANTTINANGETSAGLKLSATPAPADTPASDEENVRPSSTTPAQAEGDQGTVIRPLSPQFKDNLKDKRAYEHERQRAKRAGEWALKRARKASLGSGGVGKARADVAGVGGRKKGVQTEREDVDVEFVVGGGRRVSSVAAAVAVGTLGEGESVKMPMKPESLAIVLAAPKAESLSVSLSELIVPSKSKSKSKKSKTKFGQFGSLRRKEIQDEDEDSYTYADEDVNGDGDEEFEWVPALRAVIALDEVDPLGKRDMEVDEPWECVGEEGEDQEKKKGMSYAEVLSGMHLD